MTDKKSYTVKDASEILNVPRRTIQEWCQKGKIAHAKKYGRDWIIPATSLDECQKKLWEKACQQIKENRSAYKESAMSKKES